MAEETLNRILVSPTNPEVAIGRSAAPALPTRLNTDPEHVAAGLAQLVLTLVELIRQLLEREAIRRLDRGTLSPSEVERLGTAFVLLHEKVTELREVFGLSEEDLNIDLGPLGRAL